MTLPNTDPVIPFDDFRNACIDRGYSRITREHRNLVVFSNNSVKCEIKTRHYTFGWMRNVDELNLIRQAFVDNGFELSSKHRSITVVNVLFTENDVLEEFWRLVDVIETITEITTRERSQATRVFSKEIDEENKFLKIVKRYANAIENEDQELLDMARSLLSSDSIDRMIVRGQSEKYTPEKAYREHAVPCIMIHNEIIRMVLEKEPVYKITQMIISNLAIVLIHEDEARYMDVDLGLRTTMPDGWQFGDDIYARFNTAKIKLK